MGFNPYIKIYFNNSIVKTNLMRTFAIQIGSANIRVGAVEALL